MKVQLLVVSVVSLVLSACFVAPGEAPREKEQPIGYGPPPASAEQPPRKEARAPQCSPAGDACDLDVDCCGGTFCHDFTYAPPTCRAQLADGVYCMRDDQCASGTCRDHACASTCAAAGSACRQDSDCCGGAFCFNLTYAPWVCTPPLPAGESCLEDAQCQSGNCRNYVCAASACGAAGTECAGDDDCCAGTFCRLHFSYLPDPWMCAVAGGPGDFCNTNRQCQSLSCVNHACAP